VRCHCEPAFGEAISVPVAPIDILSIDHDGEIYIIETKLYRNVDKRHVLAQVLDYGAALWGLVNDPDVWLQELDARRISRKQSSLLELLEKEFGDSPATLEGMKANLVNGTFHFLILTVGSVSMPLKWNTMSKMGIAFLFRIFSAQKVPKKL
jgi:hypothetical protein